jgi:putative membrane protein
MKRFMFVIFVAAIAFASCNNEGTQTSTNSDTLAGNTGAANSNDANTSNESGSANTANAGPADEASAEFLKKAAEGGMAEVQTGTVAREKGTDASVKSFASMMVNDHTGANAEVKNLASKKNVTLPADLPADKKEKSNELNQKSGKAFDKAYMDMMVKDHKATIDLFEKAQKDAQDQEVKSFITATLPKLKTHLDSAQAISKRLK